MRTFLYHAVALCGWTLGALGALLGYAPHYPKPGHHPVFDPIFGVANTCSAYTALVVALGGFLLWSHKRMREPWVKPAIKTTLNVMREDAFLGHGGHMEHHHRVTLFRVRRFCWEALRSKRWPFGTWLVSFSRSDPDERSRAHFKVPKEIDSAEGIAGRAFARDEVVNVQNLPNVAGGTVGEKAIIAYSRDAFVDQEWVRSKKPKSRAIIGIPVIVGGKRWGAIVLDSRDKKFSDIENVIKSVQVSARLLSLLLERS